MGRPTSVVFRVLGVFFKIIPDSGGDMVCVAPDMSSVCGTSAAG